MNEYTITCKKCGNVRDITKEINSEIEFKRKEIIEEFIKLYEDNIKIPISKERKCKCCCNWIDEANIFKIKLKDLVEKSKGTGGKE